METTGFSLDTLQLVCDVQLRPKAHFLSLFDRIFPQEYLYPMKQSPAGGYEIFEAIAEVGERLSLMARRNECGLVIVYSDGGSFAEVEVAFIRPPPATGSVTIKQGTLVGTSSGGRQFSTLEDVVFADLESGTKIVRARAIARGYEYNVRGPRTSAGGEVLPGDIDTIEAMIQDPPYVDQSITVVQVADAVGGSSAWLDGHGVNRGIRRETNETDDLYRLRVRTVPDTVTPGAVMRAASRILDPYGIRWEFVETFDIAYQTCWDAPSPNPGTPSYQTTMPTHPRYDDTVFVYDDPRGERPFRNRWLDDAEMRGCFIVVVDREGTIETTTTTEEEVITTNVLGDLGFALGDPSSVPADFEDANGYHGVPVIGSPSTSNPDGVIGGPPVVTTQTTTIVHTITVTTITYSGDSTRDALFASLYRNLQQIKLAGVAAILDYYHIW